MMDSPPRTDDAPPSDGGARPEAAAERAPGPEARYRALMEQAPFSIQVFSPGGRTLRVNRAWEELWGVPFAATAGYNILEDQQLERHGVLDLVRRAFAGEVVTIPPIEYDPKGTLPDQSWESDPRRWVGAVAYPLKDAAGAVVEVVLVHEDITARKRAEVALERSEQKFRLLADTIPQLAWMALPDGHVVWYNRRWYEYTGTTPEQMEGWGWQSVHDPETLPAVVERWRGSLATGEPFDMVLPLRGADGAFRPFLTRVNPLHDAAGAVVYWFGTHTDISDQKRAEDAARFLAEASAALASVTDYQRTLRQIAALAVPRFGDWCAIDLVEPDGSLRRVTVTHSDPEKVELANELHRRYPPNHHPDRGVLAVARSGKPELIEEVPDEMLVAAAQSEHHLELLRRLGVASYLCVPMKVGARVFGVLSFVTAESGRRFRRTDLALAEQLAGRAGVAIDNARLYAELVEADRRKDEFLATLAHELRNPLAPIRNALEILAAPGRDGEAEGRARRMIERQVQHLVRLVDDLLDVSRVMRGRIELQKQPLELATVVALALETAQPALQAMGHHLEVELPAEPLHLDADPVRLTQVIANLLTNAAKYTPRGGHVSLRAAGVDGQAVVTVRDDGIGIEPHLLERIFDLFVQGDTSVARSQGGLGIGLTLVRSLVEMHGGSVQAHSDGPGRGSEMVVRLPLAPRRTPERPASDVVSPPQPPRRRILVVDDNVDAAESLGMLLALGGHTVRVAHDGAAALRAAGDELPEVVLLDVGMPGMDGYEVARQLRRLPGGDGVLIAALTGWGQDEDRRRTAEAGFDVHLVKPVEPDALRRLLEHHAPPRDRQRG
jgi:PAS domain S-box-containing protein